MTNIRDVAKKIRQINEGTVEHVDFRPDMGNGSETKFVLDIETKFGTEIAEFVQEILDGTSSGSPLTSSDLRKIRDYADGTGREEIASTLNHVIVQRARHEIEDASAFEADVQESEELEEFEHEELDELNARDLMAAGPLAGALHRIDPKFRVTANQLMQAIRSAETNSVVPRTQIKFIIDTFMELLHMPPTKLRQILPYLSRFEHMKLHETEGARRYPHLSINKEAAIIFADDEGLEGDETKECKGGIVPPDTLFFSADKDGHGGSFILVEKGQVVNNVMVTTDFDWFQLDDPSIKQDPEFKTNYPWMNPSSQVYKWMKDMPSLFSTDENDIQAMVKILFGDAKPAEIVAKVKKYKQPASPKLLEILGAAFPMHAAWIKKQFGE